MLVKETITEIYLVLWDEGVPTNCDWRMITANLRLDLGFFFSLLRHIVNMFKNKFNLL